MPLYEFVCPSCGRRIEELAAVGTERVRCPSCAATDARRTVSRVSPPARIGLRGGEARRAEAARRANREQRREGR